MQLAEYKYIEGISKEFNINYPYSWANLAVQKDVNVALSLLLFGFNLESMLHKEEYINNAKTIFNGVIDKVIHRTLDYYKANVDSDDDYAFLEKTFYQIKNYNTKAKTPFELLNDWPVMLSPNPFVYAGRKEIPYPYYVFNIKDDNLTRWGRDPFITLEFSLFTGCSVNCSYCPHATLHKASSEKYMSVDRFKLILDKIPKEVGLVFAGFCDPLQYDKLVDVIEYSYQKGHRLNIATTIPEDYPENIDLFLNEKYWTGRCLHLRDEFMSYKTNSDNYYNIIDKFFSQMNKQYKTNNIVVDNRFSFLGKNIDSRIKELINKNELDHVFEVCIPHTRINAPIKYDAPRQNKGLAGKIYCSVGLYRRQMITPDGDVVLCCMDVEKQHVLGNLITGTYDDIYNSENYGKFLRGFNDESESIICRNCIYGKQVK